MSSALQDFTVSVVAEVIGVEVPVLADAVARFESGQVSAGEQIVGIDIAMIIMLIETLMPMIMDMMDRVNNAIRKPGLFQRVRFRRLVNRAVRNGEARWRSESHEIGTIMLQQAAAATEEDVNAVINECRNNQMGDIA